MAVSALLYLALLKIWITWDDMAAQNNAPLPDGLEIAGYRIVKKIASGGFSIVYLASDEDGNAVAIKEYLPSSLVLRQLGELAPAISPDALRLSHRRRTWYFPLP